MWCWWFLFHPYQYVKYLEHQKSILSNFIIQHVNCSHSDVESLIKHLHYR